MTKKIKKTYKSFSKQVRSFEGVFVSKVLLATTVLSFVGYMYFVGMAGINAVSRNENLKEIKSLKTEISQLELSYIDATRSYTLSRAGEEGYVETKNLSFAKRGENVAYLGGSNGI